MINEIELDNELKKTQFLKKIVQVCDLTHFNDEISTLDELKELILEEFIHTFEIVYYSNAIKFLHENDPSLQESLSLASDLGYDLTSLNSEILATILAQDLASEELNELTEDCIGEEE